MLETIESDVQIILSIREGRGFDQVLQPTLLIGTLNGHSLETVKIESSPNPQYATDLIWETNKTTLRKMRSGQVPLKLECFAFKENESKERIGYILLNIRSAQITSRHGNLSPKANWHKLLGLRSDLKMHKPELFLMLKIEDRKSANAVMEERPDIESHKNSNGDCGKFKSAGMPYEKNCMVECKYVNEQVTNCQCSRNRIDKVMYSHSCDKTLCNCINKNYMKDAGSYHCYCLNILLLTITPISPKLSERHIEFRFHHPKADIMSVAHTITPVLNEKSKLQNIECQFHFISKADEIKQLLQSFPPKLSVYDTEEDDKLLSQIMLDIKPLFYQDQPECQYKSPLYDTDQNKIGDIDIILKLENRGPHFILKKEITDKNLGPPILDDSLAYKLVDELETWKERQKEMFKVDLKKKEERHLNILSEEWRRQKDNLETKLACSVEQCKILANSLNNATEDLRMRRLKSLENENRLIKANEDLKWTYEAKLQEFKDSLHVTQNDLTSKMNKLEEKKAALEAQVEILFYENESLKSLISKQIEELQMYQKGSLSQDQTTSLLQELKILEEKLDNAQKGKSFFKEQWGKAVREIHRMKMNHKEAMQIQIKNSKEELKNVDLAEILSIDTKALTNDQILLNELQKEIDVMKPIQSFASKETHSQVFTPVNNICSKISYDSNKILPDKSEGYNKRLQALKEERDSLLKTGSYAADDVVIKKLNTEMRYLLVNK